MVLNLPVPGLFTCIKSAEVEWSLEAVFSGSCPFSPVRLAQCRELPPRYLHSQVNLSLHHIKL